MRATREKHGQRPGQTHDPFRKPSACTGSGGDARLAELATETDHKRLEDAVKGADLVFIAAGLGGGVGTGVAPILGRYVQGLVESSTTHHEARSARLWTAEIGVQS